MSFWISLASAIITGVFALSVLRRWHEQRSRHLLAWGMGLTFFFLGTFSQVILWQFWSPVFFKLWYWAGAMVVAPWLGQGTAFLLARRSNITRYLWAILSVLSLMTAFWVAITPLDADGWQQGQDLTTTFRAIMPEDGVRIFTPMLNGWGTLLLVGGAVYSGYLFRRKAIMPERVLGNWFIAIGALLPATTGLLIRAGYPEFKYLGDTIGVSLIYVGYLLATRSAPRLAAALLNITPRRVSTTKSASSRRSIS